MKLITVLIALILFASSCGNSANTPSSEGQETDESVATVRSEKTAKNETNKKWRRTQTDPAIGNYKPAEVSEVISDPENETTVLVRFEMGAEPCSGAKASAIETDNSVTIELEIGLHKNVAAMTCVNETAGYELAVSLQRPLGGRALQAK